MFSQGIDEDCADVCGKWFAVAHRIAGVGIDHVEGGLLVDGLSEVGFEDADVLHGQNVRNRESTSSPQWMPEIRECSVTRVKK
jgi:hypothetical protein